MEARSSDQRLLMFLPLVSCAILWVKIDDDATAVVRQQQQQQHDEHVGVATATVSLPESN
ncbi:hypothetical protein KC992_01765 [Candidatus Saccharibacteria bacterium]|nr:hypothetical protein [Candidatus Saccharibacteria bacterium]MCA9328955.1 hypothetical protein [Candidatus Saccharibacteria bacterium]